MRTGQYMELPVQEEMVASPHEGRYAYYAAKRLFDITFSAAVLIGLSPLMLITALAIKLDSPGPVVFKQNRVTKNGRYFCMFKFRSMCNDAEDMIDQIKCLNEKDGPVFKIKNDPRVTRVGRIIRKTSIDELPQFVNVLIGDMSVVGPRPALPSEVRSYTEYQRGRLDAKAGITCYWQVQQMRDDIPFDEWVELDLKYIREASPLTDLKIIGKTVKAVFTGQGN